MPVEDWIERWTDIQTREMERMERTHGDRMDKIELSIGRMDKKMEGSIKQVNDKIDQLSERVDTKIDALTVLITTNASDTKERERGHAIDLAVLKTKFAIYAAVGTIIGAAAVAAIFEWVLPRFG